METLASAALALGMIAAFLLVAGGVRLILSGQARGRGVLMLAAAAVLVMNVMIWSV